MTAATENAKIAEAAKGQARARKQSPRERITSAPAPVVQAAVEAGLVERPATPAPKPTPKVKTPKGRPVLTDEQKAEAKRLQHVYILAKWARERRERAQARVNADKGMSSEDRKAAKQATLDALTLEATARKAWLAAKAGK